MKAEHTTVATNPSALKKEAEETTKLLNGKIIDKVWRHRPEEIVIQFTDGSRLFVDKQKEGLELSIT
jgi:hypothetical protein